MLETLGANIKGNHRCPQCGQEIIGGKHHCTRNEPIKNLTKPHNDRTRRKGMMIKALNLYAGLGGNRKLWNGALVTAVEHTQKIADVYRQINPSDTLIIADAHEYLLNHHQDFDFIWSSPPCQSHSRMIRSGRNRKPRYPDMKLYKEILFLRHNFKGRWLVENVKPYYEPLIEPVYIGRHAFWSNFDIPIIQGPEFKNFINRQNLTAEKQLKEWLGIKYEGHIYYNGNHCPTQVLRNCVHPDVGKHVFDAMIKSLDKGELDLFDSPQLSTERGLNEISLPKE